MSRALLYYLHGVKKMHKAFHTNEKKSPAFEIFNPALRRHYQWFQCHTGIGLMCTDWWYMCVESPGAILLTVIQD